VPGQKIHSSLATQSDYSPCAVFRKKTWVECLSERTAHRQEHIWEEDIFGQLDAYALISVLKDTIWADLLARPHLEQLAVAVVSGTF
jgi:hypothetical protein